MSWRTNGTRIETGDGRLVAYLTPWSTEADARKIAAVDDLLTALKHLRAEVSGLLGLSEDSLRDLFGNTNIAVLKSRRDEADEIIAAAEGK